MSEDLAPVPVVAARHLCGGPDCTFCEWSNPPLELPDLRGAADPINTQEARAAL